MKKTAKQIIGLSLAAFSCSALAAVLPTFNVNTASAETGVFKIADGASIRYQSKEGRPEGIRFIVLMSEDMKTQMVGKNFGFVISQADQFDAFEAANETPDYLNMQYKTTAEVAITAENVGTYIYEGKDEYAGWWCANVVINMNTENGDTEELFSERTYSAVAYYENADETGRVYTTNRQERSIQDVASKLYLSNDEDWTNVKGVYEDIGTTTTPILVAQSGKNAYNNLLDKCDEGEVDYTFELSENIIAETDLTNGETAKFKGDLNKGSYTVSSPEGYILDGTSASDLIAKNPNSGFSAKVSFDETVKYDSASNGSYKIEATTPEILTAAETVTFNLAPAYRAGYYNNLDDYKYVAIRYMIESYEVTGTTSFGYLDVSANKKCEMNIYRDGSMVINKASTYLFWGNGEFKTASVIGEWAEILLDVNTFKTAYNKGTVDLFKFQVNQDSKWNFTMYIDNIYAVKGEAEDGATKCVDKGYSLENSENISQSITYNGSVVENVTTLDNSGLYVQKAVKRNYYGTIDNTFAVGRDIVAYEAASFSARHVINATSVGTDYSAAMQDGKAVVSSNGAGKISGVSMTTYKINMFADKAYYQALKNNGYEYLTYEYTLSFTGTAPAMIYRYGLTDGDYKHTNDLNDNNSFSYIVTDSDGKNKFDTSTKTEGKRGFQSTSYPDTWNGKTFVISIPLQTVLDNYESQIRILAFYFNAKAETMDYSVTFGRIEATTNACVFDD